MPCTMTRPVSSPRPRSTPPTGDGGEKFVIAVVDAGANLISLTRMDGAWLGSLELAQKKAKTARSFDMPTEDLQDMSQPAGRCTASRAALTAS